MELQQDGGDVHNDPTRAGGDDGEDEDGADGDGNTDTTWDTSGICDRTPYVWDPRAIHAMFVFSSSSSSSSGRNLSKSTFCHIHVEQPF